LQHCPPDDTEAMNANNSESEIKELCVEPVLEKSNTMPIYKKKYTIHGLESEVTLEEENNNLTKSRIKEGVNGWQ